MSSSGGCCFCCESSPPPERRNGHSRENLVAAPKLNQPQKQVAKSEVSQTQANRGFESKDQKANHSRSQSPNKPQKGASRSNTPEKSQGDKSRSRTPERLQGTHSSNGVVNPESIALEESTSPLATARAALESAKAAARDSANLTPKMSQDLANLINRLEVVTDRLERASSGGGGGGAGGAAPESGKVIPTNPYPCDDYCRFNLFY